MIAAFGEQARRWAAGARAAEPVIAADETAFLEAIAEGVRRRMRGESFAVALLLEEDQNRLVRRRAAQALTAAPSFDHRLNLCTALAAGQLRIDGKSQWEAAALPPEDGILGVALWALSDSGVVVSDAAYARAAMAFGRWHRRRIRLEQHDPAVPRPAGPREGADHLVVWADGFALDEIPIVMCALEQVHLPVYVVGARGTHPAGVHRCTVGQSETLLRGAAAILDVRSDGPATAHALAAFGVPLATSRSSGAYETLAGVALYDPWNRDSVVSAILEAFGKPGPARRPAAPPAPIAPARVELRERSPLVSLVVPTYNRRDLLPFALESIARQRYPSIETIVVNDAGEPVVDIAERFGARWFERAANGGHAAVANDGLRLARGKYVGFLDDDDLLFPDHVDSLVEALERNDGWLAHANSLMMVPGSADRLLGFSLGVVGPIDTDQMLVACPLLGMQALLMRREAFEQAGGFDETLAPNDDYEAIVRLALRYDPIHVDRTTCLYRYGATVTQLSVRTGVQYADLYERAYERNPYPDRPLLALRRRAFVEAIRRAGGVKLGVVGARLRHPIGLRELLEPANVSSADPA